MLAAYTGAIGVAAGLVFGWTIHGWRIDSQDVKAQTQAQIAAAEKLVELGEDLEKANADRFKLAGELADEKLNIKIKYVKLKQKVPTYVPSNTEKCNYDLSLGLVRLLNSGARGEFGRTESAAEPAGQLSSVLSGQLAGAAGE